ncbi:hypothetical protein AMATHDRAFT_187814, partial [Amanita thiersii Skay4041]
MPSLLTLPPEIIHHILSYIPLQHDLLSFALASRTCARHSIPTHTQYRFIRASITHHHIWLHLAQRTDLARNIRELHICHPTLHTPPSSLSLSLPPIPLDDKALNLESTLMSVAISALVSMPLLTTFIWSSIDMYVNPTDYFQWEVSLLNALISRCHSLHRIRLLGNFARNAHLHSSYPVWRLRNLTTLCLQGKLWFSPANSPYLVHLLAANPNLEHLEVPMEFSRLSVCNLPHLKRLRLDLVSGAPLHIDQVHLEFFSNHSTIEDLHWYPVNNNLHLPSGLLPNLKRLRSRTSIIEALYSDSSQLPSQNESYVQFNTPSSTLSASLLMFRTIEHLDIERLSPATFRILSSAPLESRASLNKLVLHRLTASDPIHQLGTAFPNLSFIHLPGTMENPVTSGSYKIN